MKPEWEFVVVYDEPEAREQIEKYKFEVVVVSACLRGNRPNAGNLVRYLLMRKVGKVVGIFCYSQIAVRHMELAGCKRNLGVHTSEELIQALVA